ncbi:glycosyl hydrolase family 28 protein [Chitinophagaceae bacterium LB-8]|uniref:Glycosyl hydrolase family 28 protein n=1 Tax=Paraflavisolibacter caeni TaxID=2982496 RepID=A0A9X3BI33_9BACT|nr:glycosyl hydrolase family 28 protein [Paraflavisolibacter caeni]MCU7550642.1 glycosyl hydrolase family 28 protein [Paraflavisolibacter caeni]
MMKTQIKSFLLLLFFPFVLFAQSAVSSDQQLNIFTLGDSNGTFPESWPKQLRVTLPNAQVFNISKSGRTIGFVNNGDSTLNSLLVIDENLKKAADFTGDRPFDFIVIELGTNDAKAVFAARQKEVPANLEKLIQKIKSCNYPAINKAKIIIISPPPYGVKAETTEKYTGGGKRVEEMSKAFQKVAKRNQCLFVNGFKTPGLDINTMAEDGLHLDATASRKLIEPVVQIITKEASSFKKSAPGVKINEIRVKAPFEMPAIKVSDFSKSPKISITELGAVPGDKEKTSQAIAKAIEKANAIGGGVVVIPEGEWLTKKIHLKSNVNLHLNKGAVLLFSENPEDYLPAVHSTWEGMECYNYSPLIYAYECKNIAITGEGEVKAKMDVWQVWFARPRAHMESIKRLYNLAWNRTPVEERQMVNDTAHLRPQFIQFNRSENILLEGITITNSPFWTIHPYLCKNVVIRNVKVYAHGHNNDGVDPEMSQNVLIENCIFDQGDDAIAIKSGRNPEGWRLKTPSKNIVIRNLTVKNGHQLVAVGSELSGGIENVFVDSCTVVDGAKLNHLLFIKTNERMGGYVRNIHATNIKAGKIDLGVLGIETDVLYQWKTLVPTYEVRLTPIKDIYLENVVAKDVKFVSRILGQKDLPVENVSLKNITTASVQEKKYINENVVNFRSN